MRKITQRHKRWKKTPDQFYHWWRVQWLLPLASLLFCCFWCSFFHGNFYLMHKNEAWEVSVWCFNMHLEADGKFTVNPRKAASLFWMLRSTRDYHFPRTSFSSLISRCTNTCTVMIILIAKEVLSYQQSSHLGVRFRHSFLHLGWWSKFLEKNMRI